MIINRIVGGTQRTGLCPVTGLFSVIPDENASGDLVARELSHECYLATNVKTTAQIRTNAADKMMSRT